MASADTPTTTSLPRVFKPGSKLPIAAPLGAVARMTSAPPSFCSAAAALVPWHQCRCALRFLCQVLFVGAPHQSPRCAGPFSCKLHAKVAKPPTPEWQRWFAGTCGVTKGVEGCYAGTYQGPHPLMSASVSGKRACLRNHRLRVATVSCDAGHNCILAIGGFTTAAGLAVPSSPPKNPTPTRWSTFHAVTPDPLPLFVR